MTPVFEVLSPGLLDSVQDLGRWGWQRSGVPVSGAMDAFGLQAGNLLVGNARGAAAIEMALRGPTLRALADVLVAICGADLGATLDGEPAPPWKSFAMRCGQRLSFPAARSGTWSYLCVAGGIEVPVVLGSRSTSLRAGFGGLGGRALRAGDIVAAGSPPPYARAGRGLRPVDVPTYGRHAVVRAVPGPQGDRFEPGALESFYSAPYTVTRRADRMGYRLEGPALPARGGHDVLSEGVAAGGVQVPGDGAPIVLMADRQATGGYAVAAVVASADLALVAQLQPGSTVSFVRATVEEAVEAARRSEEKLAGLEAALR